MKNLLYVISLFALISCHSEAQKTVVDYAETITQEELKTHLYTYASDDFMGREASFLTIDLGYNCLFLIKIYFYVYNSFFSCTNRIPTPTH